MARGFVLRLTCNLRMPIRIFFNDSKCDITYLVISLMLSVAEPVQLCAEPCCLAVMCSQSVSQWEERPEEEGGRTGRLGGRSRSALVPRVSLILCGGRRKAAEKSPSCPHSETDFIYSVPSSCVLLVVSRR